MNKEKYKKRQKSSSGRIIHFETVDKTIYQGRANCTCFVTSEDKIHYWIIALAEIIWVKSSDKGLVSIG